MGPLFEVLLEKRRQRLRQLGWYRSGIGSRVWRSPDGTHLDEDEAFAWLERQEASRARKAAAGQQEASGLGEATPGPA